MGVPIFSYITIKRKQGFIMKKNKIKAVVTAGVLSLSLMPNSILAASFSGSAASSWQNVSTITKKDNTSYNTTVNWTYSSEPSHKQWFAMDKSTGGSMGSILLNYKTSKSFRTDGTKGSSYILRSKREHLGNPTTSVSGTWTP